VDRRGLTELLDRYIQGLTARDAGRLPLAPNARFTENGQALAMDQALWATASGKPYPRYVDFIDEERGQAGCFTVVDENGRPVVMSLRLRAEDGKITEAEHLVCRGHDPLFLPQGMDAPATQFARVDPASRPTRAEAERISNLYFDGIEQDDGDMIPVEDDCVRFENGLQTVLAPEGSLSAERRGFTLGVLGVRGQINTKYFRYITRIRDRRYPIFDKELSTQFGVVFFEHPGTVKSVHVEGYREIELAPFTQRPSSAMIAELFQIRDGKICSIAAILDFFPYGMKPGWE
jgi:hypothetical protein